MQDFTQHPLFERQIALEAEMAARGVESFKKQIEEAKANHQRSATPAGSYLVRSAIKPVAQRIREFMAAADSGRAGKRHIAVKYLRLVSPDVAAFVALRACLNLVDGGVTIQNAAIRVAASLETEVALAEFERQNIDEYRKAASVVRDATNEGYKAAVYKYIAGKNEIALPHWAKRDKVLLGQKLIEILVDTTGYFEIIKDYSERKRNAPAAYIYRLVGTAKCMEWLGRMEEYTELIAPDFLPTIIPPRPWTAPYGGGYWGQSSPAS
jgi:DNA-directed RNA polymerase